MRQVVIDGELYVPATEAVPNAENILRALLSTFYGKLDLKNRTIDYYCDGITIRVTDDPDSGGVSPEEFMKNLVEELEENKEKK